MTATLDADRPLDHLLILASAGSGKTFQLTNRYLRLLVERCHAGHTAPASILASTFTRLAAGEIRDRILGRLADAALNDKALSELRAMVHPDLDRALIEQLLARLVSDLHRLQLRTLDSFFAGIVQNFALELGLPPAVRVVDEDEAAALRREAVARMLDESDTQKLVDLLRALSEGRDDRRVTDTIEQTVDALDDLYRESEPGAWRRFEAPTLMTQHDIDEALDKLHHARESASDKRMANAVADDIARIREAGQHLFDGWLAVAGKGLAGKRLSGDTSYNSKEIPDDIIAAYEPILTHLRNVLRAHLAWRTNAAADLLDRYEACYEQVKRERRAVTFADLTRRILDAEHRPGFDELCFRLDGRVEHLLLDEMQDTSVLQWNALAPIAREIVSHAPPERTLFVVGDVKQSIYGWRSACPEILEHMPELLSEHGNASMIDTMPLAKSFRSAPPVIDTVNAIFSDLPDNAALREYTAAARHWQQTFDHHETAMTDLAGSVELRTAPEPAEDARESQNDARLRAAADRIEQLHRAAPDKTVGVLVRKRDTANRLLHMLGPAGLGLPAAGPGGGSVIDAPPVAAILDLLRLADHPDHSVAAFNVMHGPLGSVVGLTDQGSRAANRTKRHRVARDVRQALTRAGYRRTIQPWVEAIVPQTDAREARRLMELLDLAAEYDDRATLRADDFNRFAEARTIRTSRRAPIEVMTVHAAKGLQFTSVVLPDLEDSLVRANQIEAVYERAGRAGPITRAAAGVNKDLCNILDDVKPMYDATLDRMAREALSLLYVAVTRAEQNLFMLINPAKTNERSIPQTFAGLLRCALAEADAPPDAPPDADPDHLLYHAGRDDVHAALKRAEASEAAAGPPADQHPPDRRSIELRTDDDIAAVADPPSADELNLFTLDNVETRDRGSAVHLLFEQLDWLSDDAVLDDRSLADLLLARWPRRDIDWARSIIETFRTMLDQPEIAELLTRSDSSWSVQRERPFARRTNDGSIQTGYIDRLELHRDEHGRFDAARIIDWKTDRIDAENAPARASEYAAQIHAYADAVAHMYDLPADAVTAAIAFVHPGVVITDPRPAEAPV